MKNQYLVAKELLRGSATSWSEADISNLDTAIASSQDVSQAIISQIDLQQNKGLTSKLLQGVGFFWPRLGSVSHLNAMLANASTRTTNLELSFMISHHTSETLLPQSCNALRRLWANWVVEEIERATKETFDDFSHRRRQDISQEASQRVDLHIRAENTENTRTLVEQVNTTAVSSSL